MREKENGDRDHLFVTCDDTSKVWHSCYEGASTVHASRVELLKQHESIFCEDETHKPIGW